MGCDIVYQPDNSPQVVCRNLTAEDLDQVRVPDLDSDPVWARTQRQIDGLLADYGRVETYINLQGIQNIALDLMGQELYAAYYTDPDEVSDLLNKITDMTIGIGRRFRALSSDISGGVTGIVRKVMPENYLTSNCSVEMVSNACYEEFLLPHDLRLAAEFPCFGIHHCGKSMEHVCEGYSKVPNLAFAEVGAGSNIPYVREHLPNTWLNLRYSAVNIQKETPEQIHENVQRMLREGRAEEGKISISCVGMDVNTPEESILAFLDACQAANT
jgi:uroporphyrinogen-III decarboxylase